jgi:3-(3-hydroxy-phenyl)propionate hydroxylase
MLDVTILGGGPVGCFLAVILSDMGVSNVVIDRDVAPYQLPRAIVMDDEIQRAFHDHRMGEWLQQNTEPLQRGDFVGPTNEVVIGADIPPLGLQGVPPVVTHYQPDLDTMLRAEAERRGSQVKWGRTAVNMVDTGSSVVTTLDTGETVESRWYVACDGASSWTRKHIGLTLEDLRFDQEWLVVDAELHEGAVVDLPRGVRQYCHKDRPFTFVQGVRRYRRWEFQVQENEDARQLNTEEGLWTLLQGMISPDTARLVRSALYRFHAVVAPNMQKGNVFLAGDSAHQTPPFAGQGLNSGMRDALNLAWKLSFIKRGIAANNILDTYSTERAPHVRSTIAHAVDMGRLIDQLGGRVSH